MKAAPTCFGSHKTIIREPHPVLSYNYISGTNVRVVIDVVSVMVAYFALLYVPVVRAHNSAKYAAITLTTLISTRTLVPDM